jgi:tetratricopeptide (TPR) repeat protein
MFVATLRLAVLLLWLASPGVAMAQQPSSAADAQAKRLYTDGKVEFAQGRFDAAIALFEQAYVLSGAPGLLFNMAQAHRLAGEEHCPDALALYKSYLAALPAAENRREVEERIHELHACSSGSAQPGPVTPAVVTTPAPTPSPSPPSPGPPRSERSTRLASVLLAGTGALLLVGGGALYARAARKHAEAERECPCYPHTLDKWERLTTVSYTLLGVGGATVLGGASWWLYGAKTAQGTHAMLGVRHSF